MENSSKALLIAAAVLIVILLVTISIKVLSPAEDVVEGANEIAGTMSSTSKGAVGKLQSALGIIKVPPQTGGEVPPQIGQEGTQETEKEEENKIVKEGEIAKVNSTINGQPHNSKNPIIPAGFKPINTDTSKWDAEGGPEVDNGLVISDGNSEFVWVPVTKEINAYEVGTIKQREPDVVTGDAVKTNLEKAECTDRNKDGEITVDDFKMQLTTEFEEMAASVKIYGGFYVGRYEMSLNSSGKAQSRKEVESATAFDDNTKTWYGLYAKSKTYINPEGKASVRSSMIWGSQHDVMIEWMGNVAKTTIGSDRNTTKTTGAALKDVIKNVYDLYGCHLEWTLEASMYAERLVRGGYSHFSLSPSNGFSKDSTEANNLICSRLALYIVEEK